MKNEHHTALYPWELLLPRPGTDLTRWACVACDQYTSQPEYWEAVKETVGDAPSTLNLMLPECWLGEAAQPFDQQGVIRGVVAVYAGVSRGIDARRAVQGVNGQAAVVSDRGKPGLSSDRPGLDQSVFFKGRTGFVDVSVKAGLAHAQHVEAAAEHGADLGDFVVVIAGDNELHLYLLRSEGDDRVLLCRYLRGDKARDKG